MNVTLVCKIITYTLDKINPLPNDTFLDWSKLKAVADDKKHSLNNTFFFNRVESIMGKGENAGNQHFLLIT